MNNFIRLLFALSRLLGDMRAIKRGRYMKRVASRHGVRAVRRIFR